MKRFLALLLALVMVIGLVACGSSDDAAADNTAADTTAAPVADDAADAADDAAESKPYEGVTLTMSWAPCVSIDADQAYWDVITEKFYEETGCKVEVTINDWTELQPKYLTTFMSGTGYDIMLTWPQMLPEFIDAGFIEPMDNWFTEEMIAEEYYWDDCTYTDGLTYGMFIGGATGHRCYTYNMDILAECGLTEDDLPTTWDELLEVCEIIHTAMPDVYTFLGPLAGNTNAIDHMVLQFLAQAGGSILDENGELDLDSAEMKKAFEFEKTLMDKGYLSTDALGMSIENTQALFNEGKVAITVTCQPDVKYAEAPFEWVASTEMKDVQDAAFNGVDMVAMNAACANKEAAFAFMQYFCAPEARQIKYDMLNLGGRVRESDPEFPVDEHMVEVYAHPERCFSMPMEAVIPGDFYDIWMNVQQQILSGMITVDEGLAQFQEQVETSMAG